MHIRTGLLTGAVAVVACLAAVMRTAAAPPEYRLQVFNDGFDPALVGHVPVAVNASGVVVGHVTSPDATTAAAFTWADGVWTVLPAISEMAYNSPLGVDGEGTAFGFATADWSWPALPAAWSPVGGVGGVGGSRLLSLLPGAASGGVEGVNEAGVAVGLSGDRPVVWAAGPGGEVSELPLPAGFSSGWASRISGGGVIAGVGIRADGGRAPILWQGGVPTALHVPLGVWGLAPVGVTDAGHVIGIVNGNASYLWRDGDMEYFGDGPWELGATPAAMNSAGLVVGSAHTGVHGVGFLWDSGESFDLNSLIVEQAVGVHVVGAFAISDAGHILVQVSTDGVWGFGLLTPVPGPGTASLLVGVGVVAVSNRRRRLPG